LLTIDGEKTQVRSQDILEQGQLTTENPASVSTKDSDVSGNDDNPVKDPDISDGDETSGSGTSSGASGHAGSLSSY
jgi:hypothetical protein